MKKSRLINSVLFGSVILFNIILNSCSKQDEKIDKELDIEVKKDYTIYNKIKSFTQKMNYYQTNSLFKSSGSIEVDSAIWLMEGAVNLTYGFPFEEYSEFTTGESEISLQKNSIGEIDMDEVAIKYQALIQEAREDYHNSGIEDKGLYLVDMELVSENNDEIIINISTVTGNKGQDLGPFSPDDHWWYGEWGGGCNGNNQSGSDANQELANAYPTYDLGQCMALSGPGKVEVIGGEEWLRRPNDLLDNHNDYYVFCVQDNIEPFDYDDDLCLIANEMAGYYYGLDYVITELAPAYGNIAPGHVFINFTYVIGTFEFDQNNNSYKYYHRFDLLYGLPYDKPNCDPSEEL